jgi:hypothetical protein
MFAAPVTGPVTNLGWCLDISNLTPVLLGWPGNACQQAKAGCCQRDAGEMAPNMTEGLPVRGQEGQRFIQEGVPRRSRGARRLRR